MFKAIGISMGLTFFVHAAESVSSGNIDTLWIWIALFALAFVGILILFISSKNMSKMQQMHENVLKKQLEMEKNQALILTSMSENIHTMVKEALQKSNESMKRVSVNRENKSQESACVENTLLDITNDLIEFLRLKSKKIEIINEEFNLNNVLNEISGTLAAHFKGSDVELIFDIDNSVPRFIHGDSLHFGKILSSLLENRLSVLNDEELRLEIAVQHTFEESIELQFKLIDLGGGMTQEEVEKLFTPYYDDVSGQYVGLGLFVAQELVSMMNGTLSVHSSIAKGSSFTLTLPFGIVDASNKRKYRLPEKVLTEKKVLIVDGKQNAALAIGKMFSYFKHEVTVLGKENFLETMPKLNRYDIVILEDVLLNIRTVAYLKKIKETKELKVLSLSSLLKGDAETQISDVVDQKMFKPLNQERIFETITGMYALKRVPDQQIQERRVYTIIHQSNIPETKNITPSSFKMFSGKRLLIVEDNIINQKLLINILKHSNMRISVANNGAEAVDMVKARKSKEYFDLILMDINMPVMDGYAATRVIRAESKFDQIPIVAFTALVLDSEIDKMFNSGVNAFLAKPLNVGKLYTAMAMFLLNTGSTEMPKTEAVGRQEILRGLDTEAGIRHSNNSEALYREILKEFVEAYGVSDTVFANLVKEHRFEQLKMLCLDMRGLTATIGATEMNQKINEIQKLLLYKQNDMLPNTIEVYQQALHILTQSIAAYLKEV